MTNLHKIQWKIPLQNPDAIDAWDFFRAFSSWIPDSPEIFIDVADYRHVHDGPLIALIGHYADFYLDATDGILGLLYFAKRINAASDEDALNKTLAATLAACDRLENDSLFSGKLAFDRKRAILILNDRALAPNTAETHGRFGPLVQNLVKTALKIESPVFHRDPDARKRFALRLMA